MISHFLYFLVQKDYREERFCTDVQMLFLMRRNNGIIVATKYGVSCATLCFCYFNTYAHISHFCHHFQFHISFHVPTLIFLQEFRSKYWLESLVANASDDFGIVLRVFKELCNLFCLMEKLVNFRRDQMTGKFL